MMPTPGPARKPAAERAGPKLGEGEADFGGKGRRPRNGRQEPVDRSHEQQQVGRRAGLDLIKLFSSGKK